MILYTPCPCGSALYRRNQDTEKYECVTCNQLIMEVDDDAGTED
jgi:hypothetical protein